MTDTNVEIDLEQIANDENPSVESEFKDEPKKSKYEEEARAQGWKSPEELIAEGVDPDDIVSAKEYIRYGKLKETTNQALERKEREKEESNRAYRELCDQRLQDKMASLNEKEIEAVRYADENTYKDLQFKKQQAIQEHNQFVNQVQVDPTISAWEAKNAWIADKTNPKAQEADIIYLGLKQTMANATEADRLRVLDEMLAKRFPTNNPLRDIPTQSEVGSRPNTKVQSKLHWSDQTPEELREFDRFGYMFRLPNGDIDKPKWLRVVADDRKAKRR